MDVQKVLKELKVIAADNAITTLQRRIELVENYLEEQGIKVGEKEAKILADFVLEPFSKARRAEFFGEITAFFLRKIQKKQLFSKIYEYEQKVLKKVALPKVIKDLLELVKKDKIEIEDKELKKMFLKCFPDAIANYLYKAENGTYYLITGDIQAMWLRDSALQIHAYYPFLKEEEIAEIVRGIIKRQAKCIVRDPYAYAFFEDYSVRRRKYELDSLLYFVWLAHNYYEITKDKKIFGEEVKRALNCILELARIEQNHEELSHYNQMDYFSPNDFVRGLLKKPNKVKYTGMIWSAFRPSDDPCFYNYHIPSQIFAIKVFEWMESIYKEFYKDKEKAKECKEIREEIRKGVNEFGIVNGIFAYEVDGFGNYLLMDDANLPSLLSIPYFNKDYEGSKVYKETREFVLSKKNKYFVEGKVVKGVGSPHRKGVWTLSLIMEGLTTKNKEEEEKVFKYLKLSHAGTYLIHEAFNPDNPSEFTRRYFSMGNSLFSELVIKKYKIDEKFYELKSEK